MKKSYSKIRHLQHTNIILENRYLSEKNYKFFLNEDEGVSGTSVTPADTKLDTTNTLTKNDISKISSGIWNKIESNPELKTDLGLQPHHGEHNFLEDVAHKMHGHVDTNGHMTVEFPGLGKNHNIELDLGLSLAKHYEKDHDEHHSEPLASLKPHNFFDVGIKIPLSKMYKK